METNFEFIYWSEIMRVEEKVITEVVVEEDDMMMLILAGVGGVVLLLCCCGIFVFIRKRKGGKIMGMGGESSRALNAEGGEAIEKASSCSSRSQNEGGKRISDVSPTPEQ